MKTKKRARSPTQDCEECLPISKRITRLNIQASSRHSIEDKEGHSEQQYNCTCGSVHTSPINAQSSWQYPCQSAHHSPVDGHPQLPYTCQSINQVSPVDGQSQWQYGNASTSPPLPNNNNNLSYLPCGSRQCDSEQSYFAAKNSLHVYASQRGIPSEDLKGYSPELSESQNPHYYRINSLLYKAHIEKARREGMEMNQ